MESRQLERVRDCVRLADADGAEALDSVLRDDEAAFAATGSVDKALADAGDDGVVGHAEFGGELMERPVRA